MHSSGSPALQNGLVILEISAHHACCSKLAGCSGWEEHGTSSFSQQKSGKRTGQSTVTSSKGDMYIAPKFRSRKTKRVQKNVLLQESRSVQWRQGHALEQPARRLRLDVSRAAASPSQPSVQIPWWKPPESSGYSTTHVSYCGDQRKRSASKGRGVTVKLHAER